MRWVSTLSGIIATAAGLVVLSALMATGEPPTEAVTADGAGLLASEMNYGSPGVVWATENATEFNIDVPGLDPAVSSVLDVAGYTEFVTTGQLEGQVPRAVARTLSAAGAVLVVENGEEER